MVHMKLVLLAETTELEKMPVPATPRNASPSNPQRGSYAPNFLNCKNSIMQGWLKWPRRFSLLSVSPWLCSFF